MLAAVGFAGRFVYIGRLLHLQADPDGLWILGRPGEADGAALLHSVFFSSMA